MLRAGENPIVVDVKLCYTERGFEHIEEWKRERMTNGTYIFND